MENKAIKLLVLGESGVGKSRQVVKFFVCIFNCVFSYTRTHTCIQNICKQYINRDWHSVIRLSHIILRTIFFFLN